MTKMEQNLKENPKGYYILKKKELKNNFQSHKRVLNKNLTKSDLRIGNTGTNNPTVREFTNQNRPMWSRK